MRRQWFFLYNLFVFLEKSKFLKNLLTLILLLLLFSCSKDKKKLSDNTVDSLAIYIKKADTLNDGVKDLFYRKAYNVAVNRPNDSITRSGLTSIMLGFYRMKNWEYFNKSSNLLYKLAQESHDSIQLASTYRYKANYYKNSLINDSAFVYYLKAEKIYKNLRDSLNLGNILNNKSIVQYNVGDYIGADKSLNQAYQYLKNCNDKHKIYESLNMMGIISNETKDYQKAIDYYQKALKIIRENKIKTPLFEEASTLNNLGYNYQISGHYREAIKNYHLALKEKTLLKEAPDLYSMLIDNLAYSKFKINQNEGLPELFYKALDIREQMNATTVIVLSKIHLSEYYFEKKDTTLSKRFANEALLLAKQTKIPRDILASLKQASNVDQKSASLYSKDYFRITDSLQEVERKSQEKFTRMQLETDEIKKENNILEERNRDILNYFIGTVLFGMFLFFARAQRTKNRELVLKQAQQKANEDIYKLIISQQSKLEEGRVLEKTRIAKEIHDGILGRLFGLRLSMDGLNSRVDEESIEERFRYLNELKLIEQDLREISHELSREKFDLINNFVAIINNLLDEQIKINTAQLSANIGEDIDWDLLSNTTKINLYRILQESLQNINKYAHATKISVEFRKDKKGNLVLNIEDDGDGFDSDKKSKGIGLQNIVDRTHESEGTIDIKAAKGSGVRITVTVPLQNKTIKI